MRRAIAAGGSAGCLTALIVIALLGFKQIVVSHALDLTGNTVKAPVWAMIAVPVLVGLMSFFGSLELSARTSGKTGSED